MKRGQFSIKDMLAQESQAKAKAEPKTEPPPLPAVGPRAEPAADTLPPPDDLSPLPRPGDTYKAHARAANKPLPTLVLLMANASARGFSYANLDTVDLVPGNDPGQGPVICVRFAGIVSTEIRIAGRHLDVLYNYLGFHRTAWIRERSPSREFLSAEETVITSISIKKVEG